MNAQNLLRWICGALIGLLLAFPAAATNSDVGKEKRWAEQVVDGLLDGDAVWLLDDSGHEFLGILTSQEENCGPH